MQNKHWQVSGMNKSGFTWDRTRDLEIFSLTLSQLSYKAMP